MSFPSVDTVNIHPKMSEMDIYSQRTLTELQKERFDLNTAFYLCVVEQYNKCFYFEGSRFVEHFIKCSQEKTKFVNPLNRGVIHSSFKVYKSSKKSPVFTSVFQGDGIKGHVNLLPILLSDPSRTVKEKGLYNFMLGECYRTGENCEINIERAILFFEKGAFLGNRDAQYNLSILFKNKGLLNKYLYWILKYWKGESSISIEGLNQIALALEEAKFFDFALRFYEKSALEGSLYAIAKINFYFEEDLVIKNPPKAQFWKAYNPNLKNLSTYEYLKEIVLKPLHLSSTIKIKFPERYLLENTLHWQYPDPEKLFPNIYKAQP